MNDYLLDPNVCPASLDENDEPMNPNETAHKWGAAFKNFKNEKVRECDECGAIDELTINIQPVQCDYCDKPATVNAQTGVMRWTIVDGEYLQPGIFSGDDNINAHTCDEHADDPF